MPQLKKFLPHCFVRCLPLLLAGAFPLGGCANPTPDLATPATTPDASPATSPDASPFIFTVEADAQVAGSRIYRHATDSGNVWLNGAARLPDNWAIDRWEGVLEEHANWYFMSTNTSDRELWALNEAGDYVFVPDPRTEGLIRETLRAGLRPRVVMATSNIPTPLIEGGFEPGYYGYNVRQPNDYEAWHGYLVSLFTWLTDTFGRDEVRSWNFTFGIESDWQAKFIDPETGELLSKADNRREFMKVFDYFNSALSEVLGAGMYVGIYGSFETQAAPYLEHWATGTNFATGATGTRAGYFGFSDWYLLNFVEDYSPFSLEGQRKRAEMGEPWSAMASIAAGFGWKYDYIVATADRFPQLDGLEIALPEHGFFDTKGGFKEDGSRGPVDYLPADHRGATLFALHMIAYADAPRLAWVNPRWLLGPGNFTGNPAEDVRPPRFHALRLSTRLDNQRVLPTAGGGKDPVDGNEVRLLATAADDGSGRYHLLAVNFNPDYTGGTAEEVVLRVADLPEEADEARLKLYRIDAEHNNWWKDWTAYRKAEGIEYTHSPGVTHLGKALEVDPKYEENHLFVRTTTDTPGYRAWLSKLAEYREVDDLRVTEERTIPIRDGVLELRETLAPNSTLFVEIEVPESPAAANLLAQSWQTTGQVKQEADGSLRLTPAPDRSADASLQLGQLVPGAAYTLVLEVSAPVRVLDAIARLEGRETAQGRVNYDPGTRRIVLTAKADADGQLRIRFEAPAQPWEPADRIQIRKAELRPAR